MARDNSTTRYIDSGRRTTRRSIINMLADHFHESKGRTFDEVINSVIASGWKPPHSKLYGTRQEKPSTCATTSPSWLPTAT